MKLTTILKTSTLALITTLALSSCGDDKKTTDTTTSSETTTDEKDEAQTISLDAFIMKDAPADTLDISAMRKTASPGDPVSFDGKIIGGKKVFVRNFAVMTVGDPKKLTSCDLKGGDCENCGTPWDVCCDDPDEIKANIVTVQIADDNGKPVKTGLKGFNGLKELSEVVISGTVAKGSNKDNMIINATGIYVKTP